MLGIAKKAFSVGVASLLVKETLFLRIEVLGVVGPANQNTVHGAIKPFVVVSAADSLVVTDASSAEEWKQSAVIYLFVEDQFKWCSRG